MSIIRVVALLLISNLILSGCYQTYKPDLDGNKTAIVGFRYDPVDTPRHLESLHYFPGDYFIYTYPDVFCKKPMHIGSIEGKDDRVDTIVIANKKFNVHLVYKYKKHSGGSTATTSCSLAFSFTPEEGAEYEVVVGNDNNKSTCKVYAYKTYDNDKEVNTPVKVDRHYDAPAWCIRS